MIRSRCPVVPAAGRFSDGRQDLIERFRRGDQRAFVDVHNEHAPALSRLIGRIFPRPFEREEASQDVWLLVVRRAGAFDPARGELRAWLRVLATNRCLEILRSRKRHPYATAEVAGEERGPELNDPERPFRVARLRKVLGRFAATLSPAEAAVFKLSLLEERSQSEVAATSGVTVRQCRYLRKKVLVRALANPGLRAALEEVVGG